MIRLKNAQDLEELRRAGRILAYVLRALRDRAKEGVVLSELDAYAAELLAEAGAESAFLGYKPEGAREPYPAHICASLNDEVVHGLPDKRVLKRGDLVSLDLGVRLGRYVTDAALTVSVGGTAPAARRLIAATKRALSHAVAACRAGNHLGDVGHAIERVARSAGFRVIRNLIGHGVGFDLHESPDVYNFGEEGTGEELTEGLVLALEPMLSVGADRAVLRSDGSYATEDGSLSAHFETTVAVTKDGPEVLVAID